MKRKDINSDLVYDLINAFRTLKSTNDSVMFLQDILTANEIKNLSVRLRVAKMLLNNEKQRDISQKLHISIATTIKINSWLNLKGDGFREIIKRLPEKVDLPEKIIRGPIEFQLPKILEATTKLVISKNQSKSAEKLLKSSHEKRFSDKLHKMATEDYYKHKNK